MDALTKDADLANLKPAARGAFASLCFSARNQQNAVTQSDLSPEMAQAIANLLPILLCGEESAEFAFEHLAKQLPASQKPAFESQLISIADDERCHGLLLDTLRQSLPAPRCRSSAKLAARFLRGLASADLPLHLVRIAAVDAGLCQILAEVCHRDRPITRLVHIHSVFQRIRRDEGRHVRISRCCAKALGLATSVERDERSLVLQNFAALLAPEAASFAVLGVDFNALLARFARLSQAIPAPLILHA